jgi:hypothetical protein
LQYDTAEFFELFGPGMYFTLRGIKEGATSATDSEVLIYLGVEAGHGRGFGVKVGKKGA